MVTHPKSKAQKAAWLTYAVSLRRDLIVLVGVMASSSSRFIRVSVVMTHGRGTLSTDYITLPAALRTISFLPYLLRPVRWSFYTLIFIRDLGPFARRFRLRVAQHTLLFGWYFSLVAGRFSRSGLADEWLLVASVLRGRLCQHKNPVSRIQSSSTN